MKESSRERGGGGNNKSERGREKTDVKRRMQCWKTQERWPCHKRTGVRGRQEREDAVRRRNT